jgi:DNA-binding NarL/FixJ family response regulator
MRGIHDNQAEAGTMSDRSILALVPDVFFGARLSDSARSLGYDLRRVSTPEALLEEMAAHPPALVIVDLSRGTEHLEKIAAAAGQARLVAFGPHVDTESHRAARAAGFHEVVANSRLAREGAALLARNLPGDPAADDRPD